MQPLLGSHEVDEDNAIPTASYMRTVYLVRYVLRLLYIFCRLCVVCRDDVALEYGGCGIIVDLVCYTVWSGAGEFRRGALGDLRADCDWLDIP